MEDVKREHSVRIQTSLLNPCEKVVLRALVRRIPSFVTSDYLTGLGVVGALVIAVGYALTNYSPAWLWLANLGFVLNWLGDSLDGTLARYRNQQRPLYGFYIDHNLDCVCEFLIVLGAGLSAYMSLRVALLIIVPYLMLEVYVMINAHLKNEFRLTYARLGPTELRLIIVLANSVLYFFPTLHEWSCTVSVFSRTYTLQALDTVGLFISASLVVLYLISLWQDARYFARIDPLKKGK
ncbi:MAG: CDP-alcohol phosphatidyltransferase family protein [Bacteroidaceae bacterium]|nr:CDP-alcohol phosphatidyltransferase family protein [Bacteroidaceae bacterium]